jgi:hypothetical protein
MKLAPSAQCPPLGTRASRHYIRARHLIAGNGDGREKERYKEI